MSHMVFSGSERAISTYYVGTGTIGLHSTIHGYGNIGAIELDSLWERMYINPKPVIIVCGFCKAHNVVTSPCCIQCGAPMGAGVERQYA